MLHPQSFRAALLSGAIGLAGCNSNAAGFNLLSDPGTRWMTYAAIGGAVVIVVIAIVLYAAWRTATKDV